MFVRFFAVFFGRYLTVLTALYVFFPFLKNFSYFQIVLL